jgi:hypothetical protein
MMCTHPTIVDSCQQQGQARRYPARPACGDNNLVRSQDTLHFEPLSPSFNLRDKKKETRVVPALPAASFCNHININPRKKQVYHLLVKRCHWQGFNFFGKNGKIRSSPRYTKFPRRPRRWVGQFLSARLRTMFKRLLSSRVSSDPPRALEVHQKSDHYGNAQTYMTAQR